MAQSWQNDYQLIKRIIVKPAANAYLSQAKINDEFTALNYLSAPDYPLALRDSESFINILREQGIEVLTLGAQETLSIDSIYARDTAVVCNKGVIVCAMGKPARINEPQAMAQALNEWQIPIVGEITGKGKVEGGDVAWVDERTLAVARGYRTNDEGIAQLKSLLGDCIDELVVVPLPHWQGPNDVFHLMSIFSPIDKDLAVVYSKLMPIPFRELLLAKGYTLIEVSDEEYHTLGCNVLALAPRKVLMAQGNPKMKAQLMANGVQVIEYCAAEISSKGEGGPTCLTRPLERLNAS